jgi:manganese transport protein
VGTMAGQVIMQGFLGFTVPLPIRRLITMIPAVVIVFLKVDPTQSLFWSQVVLSLVLPIPIIALVYFTRNHQLMGSLVNRRPTTALASACAVLVLSLNLLLVYESIYNLSGYGVPGIPGVN